MRKSTFALSRRDTLVVFSDGMVEARNHAGDLWDEEEIRASSAISDPIAPLAQIPELLCAAVRHFAAGAEQYDDMTVVALRYSVNRCAASPHLNLISERLTRVWLLREA